MVSTHGDVVKLGLGRRRRAGRAECLAVFVGCSFSALIAPSRASFVVISGGRPGRGEDESMDVEAIKRRAREQFGGAGDSYVRSETHRFGKDLGRLVEVAEPTETMDALDIATGGGHTALALAPLVRSKLALDLTPEMLSHARAIVEENAVRFRGFVAPAAEDHPFEDGTFDLVTCRIAPHHFSDVPRSIHEVARVLRPGGTYVLIDSVAPDDRALDEFINTLEQRRDPSHVRSFSETEWRRFLHDAGLTTDHSELIVKRHEYASWTERSRMDDRERRALEQWVLDAPAWVKARFDIEERDGRLVSFADLKLLTRARKPS
jgi:ubiquinone/menaquinone biosynthesis C-methylase UbiE